MLNRVHARLDSIHPTLRATNMGGHLLSALVCCLNYSADFIEGRLRFVHCLTATRNATGDHDLDPICSVFDLVSRCLKELFRPVKFESSALCITVPGRGTEPLPADEQSGAEELTGG